MRAALRYFRSFSVLLLAISAYVFPTSAEEPNAGQEPASLADLARLLEKNNVSIDLKRGVVTIEGEVCIDEHDPLAREIEVLACVRGSKEYESLLSCKTSETALVAALLAVGATRGSRVGIILFWEQDRKQHFIAAQEWLTRDAALPYRGGWRFHDEVGHAGELINTANGGGVLNLDPLPSANTSIPTTLPPKGAKIRIEITVHKPPVG